MAVKIRLMRVGKKKQPTYRVVVADSRSPRDGRIIETLGHYGPRAEPSRIEIDGDKALAWLRKGAQPTESVQKLLTVTGVWATFESERGTVATKLSRRGHLTGRVAPKAKAEPAPTAPAPAGAPAPAAEPPEPAAGSPGTEPTEEPPPTVAAADATPEEGDE